MTLKLTQSWPGLLFIQSYGGPQVSRQNKKDTAKQKSHGKIKKPRQIKKPWQNKKATAT